MLGWLSDVQLRQLPWASVRALDAVGKAAVEAERAQIAKAFKLLRPLFVLKQVVITRRPTKADRRVVITIAPQGDFLGWFEAGLDRTPLGNPPTVSQSRPVRSPSNAHRSKAPAHASNSIALVEILAGHWKP